MKWSVCEKFKDILYYAPSFTVFTDCNPLSYIMSSAKLNATTIRWVGELSNFNFTIKYRPGKQSVDCDYLSRNPVEDMIGRMEGSLEELSQETIGAMVQESKRRGKYAVDAVNVPHLVPDPATHGAISQIPAAQLMKAQEDDEVIGVVFDMVKSGVCLPSRRRGQLPAGSKVLLKQWKKLRVDDCGLLVRETENHTQLVLPSCYKALVFEELNVKMGHLGPDRVVQLAQERFFWPKMVEDIHHFVTSQCQNKSVSRTRNLLGNSAHL